MRVIKEFGHDDLAKVHLALIRDKQKNIVEFVESIDPPIPREDKWVLIVSSMYGCPCNCLMCDAGGNYSGILDVDDILQQIDYVVSKRFPTRKIPVKKFKIQLARVGEPSLNLNVLKVLEKLPIMYDAPGMMPCISTVAPTRRNDFFDKLIEIKNKLYSNGHFQMQFSIHSTDPKERDRIIPIKKWSLEEIAQYGKRFYKAGDRKIALNFIVMKNVIIDPMVIKRHFDPHIFLLKVTPLNPTKKAFQNNLESGLEVKQDQSSKIEVVDKLKESGLQVILSIGHLEENKIGSNCGQFISAQ